MAQRLNPTLRLTGVVLCMYESGTRLAAEVTSDVQTFFDQQKMQSTAWADAQRFETVIRRNIRLAEAPSFGQSIFEYSPHSNGAVDYEQLAREVHGDQVAAEQPTSSEILAAESAAVAAA